MNTSQQGSVKKTVLVLLVIVLAGVLGFVVWQNYAKKDADKKPATTQTQTQTEPPKPPEKVLALSQWGLEIPLGESTTQYEAFAANSGDVSDYGITLKNLASIKGCDAQGQGGPAPLGHLTFADKDYAASMGITYDAVATVDGKEYGWQAEKNAGDCAASPEDKQTIVRARDEMTQLVKKLRRVQQN